MSRWEEISLYQGKGEPLWKRGKQLPAFDENLWAQFHDPAAYEADNGLRDAVNVALTLGLPLLITGEPGTGKTELAYSIAWEMSPDERAWETGVSRPLIFRTKSNSTYTDLFYRYDALRHFQDVQIRRVERPIEDYISFGPLGEAILRAANRGDKMLPDCYRGQPQQRSVVLIDEIDKAPRDLPNDILNEFESMSFEIPELRHTFEAAQAYRPILILTSNLERDLPEAFRRRCAFFHIEFPDKDEKDRVRLFSIIRKRIPKVEHFTAEMLSNAVALFIRIRGLQLDKNPATAELLNWVDLLQRIALDVRDGKLLTREEHDLLSASFAVLAKSDDDLRKLRREFAAPQSASAD